MLANYFDTIYFSLADTIKRALKGGGEETKWLCWCSSEGFTV